jgi:hypothetical protein
MPGMMAQNGGVTIATVAARRGPASPVEPTAYQPGVCNIGPAEIARRRRLAYLGAVVTAALIVGLLAIQAPPLVRLVLVGGAAFGTAVDYLQVRLRFCVAFASRAVFNFGPLGVVRAVTGSAARARDRAQAARMVVAGGLVGLLVGLAAALLPT